MWRMCFGIYKLVCRVALSCLDMCKVISFHNVPVDSRWKESPFLVCKANSEQPVVSNRSRDIPKGTLSVTEFFNSAQCIRIIDGPPFSHGR